MAEGPFGAPRPMANSSEPAIAAVSREDTFSLGTITGYESIEDYIAETIEPHDNEIEVEDRNGKAHIYVNVNEESMMDALEIRDNLIDSGIPIEDVRISTM